MKPNPQRQNEPSTPEWWETLRTYLSAQQQGLFVACYQKLFSGKQSSDLLWTLVNILGLVGVIQHNIAIMMVRQIDAVKDLTETSKHLVSTSESGAEGLLEASLRAHEAAVVIRQAWLPWYQLVLIGMFIAFFQIVTTFAAMDFYLGQKAHTTIQVISR
jgi:predicted anti-sigma-YlaC factor YlaD